MRATVAALVLLTGCGGPPAPAAPSTSKATVSAGDEPTSPAGPRQAACEGEPLGASQPFRPQLPIHGTIVEVTIEGLAELDEAEVRRALRAKPGPLDPAVVAADLRRLWDHDAITGVVVTAHPAHDYRDDLRLVYRITERAAVGQIFVDGDTSAARDLARRIEGRPLVEPHRIHAEEQQVLDELHRRGHRSATLWVTAHPGRAGVDLCIHAEPGAQTTVARWSITGVTSIPEAELEPIYAHAGIGREGAVLDDEALALAMMHLQAAYWNHGHLEATIGAPAITDVGDDQLEVAIAVVEGPVYRYRKVTVDGHARAAYPRIIAPLETGTVFQRSTVMEVIEALREYHAGEKLEVDTHTHLDRTAHVVDLELRMVPPGTVTGTM